MEGTMQSQPMLVTNFLDYAARWHAEQEIVCKTCEGDTHISNYADLRRRSQLCALALTSLGIG
jgi:fatty-acyl-CoA synthase